ncbi:MAG: sugar phosphate isomerase/epimerase family protein [Promethearchaeota archaeon]
MTGKISVLTDEFGEPDFEKVAEFLASKDFEYVELRGVWIKNVFHLDDIDIAEIKDILNDNGLKVSSVSGGLLKTNWPGPPGEQETMEDGTPIIEYQMKMADNCLHVAEELDAKYIRAFGFHRIQFFEEEMWPDWFKAAEQLIKKAEKKNKTVIIENEHGCMISGLDSIQRAFNKLHSPSCKLLLDPGNLLAAGERFTKTVFDVVKDITGYIHVKDAKIMDPKSMSTRWALIGEGDVGWQNIIDMFTGAGYDSFWSVETHMGDKSKKWEYTAKNLEILRKMLGS